LKKAKKMAFLLHLKGMLGANFQILVPSLLLGRFLFGNQFKATKSRPFHENILNLEKGLKMAFMLHLKGMLGAFLKTLVPSV